MLRMRPVTASFSGPAEAIQKVTVVLRPFISCIGPAEVIQRVSYCLHRVRVFPIGDRYLIYSAFMADDETTPFTEDQVSWLKNLVDTSKTPPKEKSGDGRKDKDSASKLPM